MKRKIAVLIFTLLFVFFNFPFTAFGDNSSGDHQNTYDELEEIAQTYRRFVSVNANEDCSSFSVVINDAANWGRAEEIAEEQLYDYAQRHANSGNKNDVIGIHYMNMNGDEVYFHSYNGSVVLPPAAGSNSQSESITSNGNLAGGSDDHQNTDNELEKIAQTYRRFVSVNANEDCSSFSVVINDAANWGRAEEIAEEQLYDYAQRHANSGNKNDVIGIHYMNMNGDEVYYHRYNGSLVVPTTAETNSPSASSYSLADSSSTSSSSAASTGSSATGSSDSNVSNWNNTDNSSGNTPSTNSTGGSSQSEKLQYVLNTNTYKFHLPGCREINKMSSENKRDYFDTRENIIAMGYSPCGKCNP